jgi:hypothetical protein
MRALKLESLRIQNFRTFRDLTIDRLGRVNLIVGKNNVGTTSLLEAVHFYAGGGIRGGLSSLASSRELDLLDTYRSTNRSEFGVELPAERHLFFGRPDLSEVAPDDEEIEGLPDRRFDPKDEGKAHIHTWLAWQETPREPIGRAIRQGVPTPESALALRFVNWVRRLFPTLETRA